MFDVIERLKSEWTDRYVVIDSPAPELARFAKATGQVKTVNMNGRCLVEFDQYNNIGWYDIDPSALKIVPKPLPKPPEEKPAKAAAAAKPAAAKPAAAAKPTAAKPTAAKPAAAKPAGKLSTAEILAKARAAKAAPASEPPAQAPVAEEAEVPAAAPAAPAPKAKAGGPLPTTTADKIAWCRSHDAKG
jgi:hypothetical protein